MGFTLAQALLQKMGLRVASAKDGAEGLSKLTDPSVWAESGDEPPFLFALVDMIMPVMDGCEMARRASALTTCVRFCALQSRSPSSVAAAAPPPLSRKFMERYKTTLH